MDNYLNKWQREFLKIIGLLESLTDVEVSSTGQKCLGKKENKEQLKKAITYEYLCNLSKQWYI